MKTITIKSMALRYFKGVRSLDIEFGPETTIAGCNGAGKSTVMDAFFWLLWGKNAAGLSDTNFGIKTVDEQGEEIPNVNHEVTATLTIDGVDTTLQRVLVPEYDKKGNLKGNHTDYTYNEVPMKKKEYDEKIHEIIDEEVFKFITSPYAFLSLDWKSQRDMLVKMAGGEVSDSEIAGTRKDFTELVAQLTGKTLEEYRRELDSKIKTINERMAGIPDRIDELQRTMPELEDEGQTKARKAELEEQRQQLVKQMSDRDAAIQAAIGKKKEDADKTGKILLDLQRQKQQIIGEAESKARNEIHKKNVERDNHEAACREAMRNLNALQQEHDSKVNHYSQLINGATEMIAQAEKQVADLRNKWMETSKMEYSGEDYLKCPIYGHTCTDKAACGKFEENSIEAFQKFNEGKRQKLASITEQANTFKADIENYRQKLAEYQQGIEEAGKAYESAKPVFEKAVEEENRYLAEHPHLPLIAKVDESQIEGLSVITKSIESTQKAYDAIMAQQTDTDEDSSRAEQQQELSRLNAAISLLDNELQKAETCRQIQARCGELEQELTKLGQDKSELELKRKVTLDFEMAKMDAISDRINGMFNIVKWRLFTRQVNGEVIPACIPLVNGVRWPDANLAGRINSGIDIATTIGSHYGVSAPMFIDNTESIGEIFDPGTTQRILLRHDPKMHVLTIL